MGTHQPVVARRIGGIIAPCAILPLAGYGVKGTHSLPQGNVWDEHEHKYEQARYGSNDAQGITLLHWANASSLNGLGSLSLQERGQKGPSQPA